MTRALKSRKKYKVARSVPFGAFFGGRPTDTVFQQKMFFEVFKQFQGEYLGSLLGSTFESLGGAAAHDEDDFDMHSALGEGLSGAVKDNDSKFPPEWRLSKSGRKNAKPKTKTKKKK